MPTILSCAVTGNIVTPRQHPALPVTPREIADAAISAARAGAAIAHIHVRDPETGKPSTRIDLFSEVVDRIRASDVDVIINLSTGEGGRFVPSPDEPKVFAEGTTLTRPEHRVAHVLALQPEICSLDLNTMFSGTSVVINTPSSVIEMAYLVQQAGVKPELEVFDSGDIHMAKALIAAGQLGPPHFFQIVTGVRYGAVSTVETIHYMRDLLPEQAQWSAFGIGRAEFPIAAASYLLGGHIRVGMEDNIYIKRGILCRDNAQLVERAATIIDFLGGVLATPAEARELLGLERRSPR